MPTYEYACRDCGQHIEVVQSFRDDPLTVCPSCEGALRKVFSAAGIVFKGSGWHIKDYAAKKPAPAESSSKSNEKSGSKDAVSTSDTTSSTSEKKSASSSNEKKSA